MAINPSIILTSMKLSIMTILLISMFFFSKSYIVKTKTYTTLKTQAMNIFPKTKQTPSMTYTSGPFAMQTLKILAFLSLMSLFMTVHLKFQNLNTTFSIWIKKTSSKMSLKFNYDQYFLLFVTVALFVTWSMMEFSYYYMKEDPKSTAFYRLLMMFLLKMLLLTCSNSLFLMFLGWEGVGFLSFLLMSWWTTRKEAKSSALEAMIYKRLGDMGFMTFMALTMLTFNSWNMTEMLLKMPKSTHLLPFMLFGLMLAAAGKSAQFGLHPWLPAAMEGPTPVSALLHSSTMVVAGVFLLMRTDSLLSQKTTFQTMVLLLGGITALFAATTAMAQHDMKKIMAYSTTSQLGLMMTSLGLGQPLLAFFHICTHAFFKAMLFLCSGSMMHSLNDEQDLRKMSGLKKSLPTTSACLTMGSLALMGTPFLAGFYSKDLILEAAKTSHMKTLGLSLSLMATMLTAAYSFRMIQFCFISNPSMNSLSPLKEENHNLSKAIMRLALGTMMSGWFFSNFILISPTFTIKLLTKSTPMMATMTGMIMLLSLLAFLSSTYLKSKMHTTLTNQWFFTDINHSLKTLTSFYSSLFLTTRILDRGWQEKMGPQGVATMSTAITKKNQITQKGLMKRYMISSLMLIFILMTTMIITSS